VRNCAGALFLLAFHYKGCAAAGYAHKGAVYRDLMALFKNLCNSKNQEETNDSATLFKQS